MAHRSCSPARQDARGGSDGHRTMWTWCDGSPTRPLPTQRSSVHSRQVGRECSAHTIFRLESITCSLSDAESPLTSSAPLTSSPSSSSPSVTSSWSSSSNPQSSASFLWSSRSFFSSDVQCFTVCLLSLITWLYRQQGADTGTQEQSHPKHTSHTIPYLRRKDQCEEHVMT